MNPRRLIPYVVVLLVLVGTFVGLKWHQAQKETREQQAKQVFNFKDPEISTLTLKRGPEEIQLTRQGAAWEITKPLKAKADPATVESLVKALAQLKMDRDLGPGDLKTFALDQPGLVVSFTAKGEQHHLAVGSQAPANKAYYVRKDDGPNILLISTKSKDSLDQQLMALRDKTLWNFNPDQVKSIKIRTDKTLVDLEKSGADAWRWLGRTDFRIRSDRVEQLLRQIQRAQISNFPTAKDLQATGLTPPMTEVILVTPQGAETLFLGSGTGAEIYARLGTQGEVVRVNKDLVEQLARITANLEDRRLWTGHVPEVGKVVWGPPDKTWTAMRDQRAWKAIGPDKAEFSQAPRLVEAAILSFKNLEYSSLLPPVDATGPAVFTVEFLGVGDKSLFRLEELGKKGETGVAVRTKTGDTTVTCIIPQKDFARWQAEMSKVTTPPPDPMKSVK